jgi:ArsR family transcriptional regulator
MSMKEVTMVPDAPVVCCTPVAAPRISDGEAANLASVFRALGDPNRVRIVSLLANAPEPVCVCDLTGALGVSQATTSFHLKKLAEAGFLLREQRGVWAYYSLAPGALRSVARAFEEGSS